MKLVVPIMAALVLLGACAARPQAFPTPPALPVAKIPLPPVSDVALVWQPGDWVYTTGSYRYDPGQYVPAEGHGSNWIYGHWAGTPDHYVWVAGAWLGSGMH